MSRRQHQLDVPAQGRQAFRVVFELSERQASRLCRNEAHGARSGAIKLVEFPIGDGGWNDNDYARRNVHLARRIELPTVVGSVTARLDQHRAR